MSYVATVTAIVGKRGTGKTYQAKARVATTLEARARAGLESRLVVFDPMREWWPKGALRVESRVEYLRGLRAGRFPLVVETPALLEWSPLEEMRDCLVMIDEAHNYATAHKIDDSFRKLLCESRHFDTDVVVATQRPRHLNPAVLANASAALILPLQHDSDRSAVEDGLGVSLPPPRRWKRILGPDGKPVGEACEPLEYPRDFNTDSVADD